MVCCPVLVLTSTLVICLSTRCPVVPGSAICDVQQLDFSLMLLSMAIHQQRTGHWRLILAEELGGQSSYYTISFNNSLPLLTSVYTMHLSVVISWNQHGKAPSQLYRQHTVRLRSHWYEYEYEFRVRVSVYGSYKLHPYERSRSLVQGQLNACLPTISRKIESRKCFAKK